MNARIHPERSAAPDLRTDENFSLPGWAYSDPEFFELERQPCRRLRGGRLRRRQGKSGGQGRQQTQLTGSQLPDSAHALDLMLYASASREELCELATATTFRLPSLR